MKKLLCLLMVASFLVSCSASSHLQNRVEEEQAEEEDDGFNIKAWPLVVSTRSEDGSRTVWATPLFHYTREADGAVSFHVLNYLQGENYWALIPLAYHGGEPGAKHTGIIPLYFGGPGYDVLPPLLSLSLDSEDHGRTLWITPLFHHTRDANDNVSFHLLNYFQGPDYKLLFPFAYEVDTRQGTYSGILPFYLQGPENWCAPIALSGGWDNDGGGTTFWITPLFHYTVDASGKAGFHALNFFKGEDGWCLFPLVFSSGEADRRHLVVLPFFINTQDSLILPLLLSGAWKRSDGGGSLWITPLFHHTRDGAGGESFHVLNYFQGRDYKVFFPFFFTSDENTFGIVPLYFQGEDWWALPPLLSGAWATSEGGRSLWLTPLFHHTRDANDDVYFHVLNYFQGPDYKVLFPLAYAAGEEGFGILPLYFKGEGWWTLPLLLSGGWDRFDGGKSLWLTPIFHHTRNGAGDEWFHLLNYFQGPDYKVLFPLAYAAGEDRFGIVPIYFQGQSSWYAPLLLSGGWDRSDDGRSLWITPLFHHTRDGNDEVSFHVLNYFQGPDYKVLFPLAYTTGEEGSRSLGIIPFYFQNPESTYAPLLLTASWIRNDGGRSTWVTPFFHQRRDAEGGLLSRHILNWFEGSDYEVLFPLYWNWRNEYEKERTLIPLLYFGWRDSADQYSHSPLWPLFEYRNGEALDTSLSVQLKPFVYQGAGEEDYEFNFLWRLFHLREEAGASRMTVGPFWWSGKPAPDLPSEYQVLGGLFARDCDYDEGTYRYRIFWFIPVGAEETFNL